MARPTESARLVDPLASVPHDNSAVPELLRAAGRLRPATPAWASAAFYGINLEIKRGENDVAHKWADQVLTTNPPPDIRNAFLAQRMTLATTWDDLLRYGPRQPNCNHRR
jgi:hypothetical protein